MIHCAEVLECQAIFVSSAEQIFHAYNFSRRCESGAVIVLELLFDLPVVSQVFRRVWYIAFRQQYCVRNIRQNFPDRVKVIFKNLD